jgi:multidrug efflux pump subunit AcrA (membrane-fusion protein)
VSKKIAAILSFAAILTSCTERQEAPAAPTPVKVGKARRIHEPRAVAVSGSVVSPDNPSSAAFLVAGKVIHVVPREGDAVSKGQVLAVVDPEDYSLALKAAVAQAGMAQAALQKAEAPARPELLEQAKIAFERTRDEYNRMKQLYDAKSLAPNDFQKFKAARDAAEQQLRQAQAGGQKEDREQARSAYNQANAAVDAAKKRLADTTLRSPIDGYVAARLVELGDVASPGRPVFQIVRLDPVEISVGVPETDVHLVRVGQKAGIQAPALPGETYTGTVRVINVAADPSTRSYMVRIQVPNPKRALRVGMIAEARIVCDGMLDALTLPGEAISRDPQGATIVYVYFPDQKRVYSKRVEVGTVYGKEVEVKSGLTGDEAVVLGGQGKLRDGAAVAAVEEPAAGAAPEAK